MKPLNIFVDPAEKHGDLHPDRLHEIMGPIPMFIEQTARKPWDEMLDEGYRQTSGGPIYWNLDVTIHPHTGAYQFPGDPVIYPYVAIPRTLSGDGMEALEVVFIYDFQQVAYGVSINRSPLKFKLARLD